MGERLLERWLRHPLCDSTEINSRLDITSFFIEEGDLRDQIRNEGLKVRPSPSQRANREW